VVAGHEEQRDLERAEDLAQQAVLLGGAVVGEVARREHDVGPRRHRVQVRDRAREQLRSSRRTAA
jgi:hypothetical protein